MSFATVKRQNGTGVVVSNTVKSSVGVDIVVSDDVLDTGATAYSIFGVSVLVAPVYTVEFDLFDNRVFEL